MTDYIEREAAINAVLGITICNPAVHQYANAVLFNLNKLPAADVVPWAWLESYADGKRTNFCSGFVIEAKMAYNKED